jgi:hypothetical protein
LTSGFFLAPEGETDYETNDSFFSNEYKMKNENEWLVIQIGDEDPNGKKRSKITYGKIENSKMKEFSIQSPILRKEQNAL